MSSKCIFVSGLSGSGKTTTGERLKKDSDYLHFNVDVWVFGGDPVAESAAVPDPAMMAKQDPEIKKLFDDMIANGFRKLAAGETVPLDVWTPFFSRLCTAVNDVRKLNPNKNLVVTFSAYTKQVRNFIREQLGADIGMVVLNPSIEKVGFRKVQHLKNTAEARGQTLSQFLKSFHPGSEDTPDLSEEVIVGMLTEQARAGLVGFEPADEAETRTLAIGDMEVADVHKAVVEFAKTL
jgi:gluconate kinase